MGCTGFAIVVLNGQAFYSLFIRSCVTANQRLRPVICHVPVTISKHLAKGKEHRKEIRVSLFHYYATQSSNNTDPLLLLNYYAIKSFINIYKLEREGLLLVGHQVGEGWLLAS
jgi:hypothetical protein